MFEIPENKISFIQKEKENMSAGTILSFVQDTIIKMLENNLPKSYILDYINRQLNTNIKLKTFHSFLARNNLSKTNKKNNFKLSTKNQNQIKNKEKPGKILGIL
jgi:site-specific recombinase XerD